MILVTGATGNIGRELIRLLVDAAEPVRALIRSPSKNELPANIQTAVGDFNQPPSLSVALTNVRRVFLLGGYGDMPRILAELRRAGVEHVVLLSSRSAAIGDPSNAIVNMWMTSEAAVRESGVAWTILRPSTFMSNALRWLPQLRSGDVVRVGFPDVAVAVIDPYDIAATAAAALASGRHHGQTYVLSGPETLLPEEQVRVLGAALGRALRFERQSHAETRAEMSKSFPPDFVEGFFRFYAGGVFDESEVLPTVQAVTGRSPRTFAQWANVHAAAFR